MSFTTRAPLSRPAAILGGALWAVHAVFVEQPFGADRVYRPDIGYEEVVDPVLFLTYSLPGSLGRLFLALALLGIIVGRLAGGERPRRPGRLLALVAVLLGVLSVVGTIAFIPPLEMSTMMLGWLVLVVGLLRVGLAAHATDDEQRMTKILLALGLLGLLSLALRPLGWMDLIHDGIAVAAMVSYGLGWVVLGLELRQDRPRAAEVSGFPHAGTS